MRVSNYSPALGLDGDLVDKENFPLKQLAKKLDFMRREIYAGRGFALLRGLDVNKYSVDDMTIIYLGIQRYIGNHFGRQDKAGNMLGKCTHPVFNSSILTNPRSPHCRRQLLTYQIQSPPPFYSSNCKLFLHSFTTCCC